MKLMLIGGGDVGRGNTSYETGEIDCEIVKMTEKVNPVLLFIGLASSFSDSYYDTIKKIYSDLGCTTMYLKKKNIINNPDIVKDKISCADIIYFCGGDSVKLINEIKEYNIDVLLKSALDRGCVLAGMSAGAILLSKKGYSDSLILRGESDNYEFIDGLSFFNNSFCPHYNDNKRMELMNILEKNNERIYCLEDCTALKIIDNNIDIVKSKSSNKVSICYYDNCFIEKEL